MLADAAAGGQRITQETVCAGLDMDWVRDMMVAAYGKPAHHCLTRPELALAGKAQLAHLLESKSILRITGPIADGFFVRALTVMSQALWARRVGLPVSVAYRSEKDAYLDAGDKSRDGWTQYFAPVLPNASVAVGQRSAMRQFRDFNGDDSEVQQRRAAANVPIAAVAAVPASRLAVLDCSAGARVWEAYANYAPTFRAAALQRHQRASLVRTIPIEPRHTFRRAAAEFWRAHGLGGVNGTLGVHLRGTDKGAAAARRVKQVLPLVRAFLCHRPSAKIFAATDDARLLTELRSELAQLGLPADRLVWRAEAVRSDSGLNPGFHAEQLHLRGKPGSRGRPP